MDLCLIFTITSILLPSLLAHTIQDITTTVLGVSGGKVALPCNITPPTTDDAVSLILWYKDESTTPLYSLDARKGNLDQARHASEDNLISRSYMNTIQRPAHLILEMLSIEDAGEYRCRVDFRKAQTRNSVIYLEIIVPPDKPVIMDANSEPQPSLIGPYNEGDRLVLVCEVEGGKPTPSLTWWRESVLLDDSFEVMTNGGTVRNELEIQSLQRHDLMAVFTCQASNNNISMPTYSAVSVDLNFRPVLVRIEGDRKPLSADKSVEVVCTSAGSRPPATISWWKGSIKMKKTRDKISVDGNVTTSTLTFTPSSDDSGKYLSCRAENNLIQSSAIEDGWKLEIYYVPQLSLRLGSKLRHSHIQEGNDVYFECNIRAAPWVTEIRWWFEGKEIHTNTSAGVIVSNQSLVLQRVQRLQRGRYTCSAVNNEGEGESNSVHLRVQYAPVCKQGQKILYGAARHESVKIYCEVDSDPPEVSFRWGFNSSGEHMEIMNHMTEGSTSVATYMPRTEFDYGALFCWARNSVGPQVEPCTFTIIPAGPPDAVKNCTVLNVTEDSIKVDCVEGYDGGLLQHFILEIHDTIQHKLRANITSAWPSFTAKRLPSGSSFLIVIYAANAKGRSKGVALTANTLSLPESMNRMGRGNVWQLSFSPVLALLITIVCALVIIAFVIVIVMKFRSSSARLRNERDISLASSEAITRNSEIDDDMSEKCNNSLTTPLTQAYGNGMNGGPDGLHHHQIQHNPHNTTAHWRASPPPSPPSNHRTLKNVSYVEMPLQVPSNCLSSSSTHPLPALNTNYIIANCPPQHPVFSTLQHPRRVRVLPPQAIRSNDDINTHQHTDV
ncbi:kin of IRRE-like protein 3 isoform X2 [Oppia nitens]|uniref:kin of IRRE-like protein 3 isoform X2 n=1 Tax=Oppia nitens TaxID=1686743 RepID=UPI0023DB9B97|nr:kin of IRRE-like protein 3 isoform X2 [Oppia nitens]